MSAAGGGGAGAVVRQGHLRKLKTMKKKYFVLRAESADCSARLDYYESEKKFRAGAAPRRVLPLKSCYNITRRLDLKQKHVIALFTREEQFCVVAENEQELHGWLSAILRQHSSDEHSDELLHPIQHVWQVNVQKKGLGASKNIQGLYNLCLTDKTLALVKIKSHNNVISDLGIPEKIEYSLKNIRRCGDSECFFYMEVGRQTATGDGELWMHTDDSNIAQSMHSTIYHAMRNCAKETENERDHITMPKSDDEHPRPRRQTVSEGQRPRAGLSNEKGLCVDSCITQCVCSTTYSIDDSAAAIAPLTTNAENQPPNNSLTDKPDHPRLIKHHRTVSLPTGCPLFQEPLKIVHERTRSAPLTGDEVDRVTIERAQRHSSCKAVNGTEKKTQWSRRASTGTRLSKLSPAHTKNATGPFRNRCDSMPSKAFKSLEVERPPTRHSELIEGLSTSHDEADAVEWHRTPRIPEEPDYCEMGPRDRFSKLGREPASHSRTSSIAASETSPENAHDGYLPMAPEYPAATDGYLPMAPLDHGLVSASSGSVCSGTPSTDPRFSEYQLEPAMSHIIDADERPPRAYSVGSRPVPPRPDVTRLRAYSVGARNNRVIPAPVHKSGARASSSAPLLPRTSADDLMELDFSHPEPAPAKVIVSRTPPAAGFVHPRPSVPRPHTREEDSAGYVEMRPGALGLSPPRVATTPDGYVEMNLGSRTPLRPAVLASSPQTRSILSDTLFPLTLESPGDSSSPEPARPPTRPETKPDPAPEHHPLTTLREISEECPRKSPELSSSPSYVALSRQTSRVDSEKQGNPTIVKAGAASGPARFDPRPPSPGLHYAALDLDPRAAAAPAPPRVYTQIDFLRSEKLAGASAAAADN
ncbi:insulin receptor substrate 1-B isoform X1 [Leguminivora glycinivorella]|uniref:insulin receptor substrate 1-B isoform X1 n=1 Tax=Leguminivora glycinivorella TaxID=1035111 RepID=UPI00200FAD83|nr:insulin receptor substrate 1-B isoform X1 [Leguminivora glycinivorella]